MTHTVAPNSTRLDVGACLTGDGEASGSEALADIAGVPLESELEEEEAKVSCYKTIPW